MTVNEKMSLVIALAEKALEKNELPIASFIGKIYYSLDAPSDSAAKWAEKTWDEHHVKSSFYLPDITSGVLESESKELFKKYIDIHKRGALVEWVKGFLI